MTLWWLDFSFFSRVEGFLQACITPLAHALYQDLSLAKNIVSSILLLNLKSQINFHIAESTDFNVAYDKCDGNDNPERCIESSYLSWKDVMLGINLPDPPIGADDGTTNRPVGQFVTKNQTKNNRRKKVKKKKTQVGLNDEQLIAAGTGVKGSTAFAATTNKRDRRKRKNNRNKKNNNKMYWGGVDGRSRASYPRTLRSKLTTTPR